MWLLRGLCKNRLAWLLRDIFHVMVYNCDNNIYFYSRGSRFVPDCSAERFGCGLVMYRRGPMDAKRTLWGRLHREWNRQLSIAGVFSCLDSLREYTQTRPHGGGGGGLPRYDFPFMFVCQLRGRSCTIAIYIYVQVYTFLFKPFLFAKYLNLITIT